MGDDLQKYNHRGKAAGDLVAAMGVRKMRTEAWIGFGLIFVIGKVCTILLARRLLRYPGTTARQFAWQTALALNVTIFFAITVPLRFKIDAIIIASIIAMIGLATAYTIAYFWFLKLRKAD
jgi:uncharacterized membrane protein YjjP (DUF1212 family)